MTGNSLPKQEKEEASYDTGLQDALNSLANPDFSRGLFGEEDTETENDDEVAATYRALTPSIIGMPAPGEQGTRILLNKSLQKELTLFRARGSSP